jgi:hypothetical protein
MNEQKAESLIGTEVSCRPPYHENVQVFKIADVARFHGRPLLVLENGYQASVTECSLLDGGMLPQVQ